MNQTYSIAYLFKLEKESLVLSDFIDEKIIIPMNRFADKHPWFSTIFCAIGICIQIILLVVQLMLK